jgi:hypothetical protein
MLNNEVEKLIYKILPHQEKKGETLAQLRAKAGELFSSQTYF